MADEDSGTNSEFHRAMRAASALRTGHFGGGCQAAVSLCHPPKPSQAFTNCMYKLFYRLTPPCLNCAFPPSFFSLFLKTTFCSLWSCMQRIHLFFLDYVFKKRKKGRSKEVTENCKNPESNVSGTAIILYEAAGKIDCQGSKG